MEQIFSTGAVLKEAAAIIRTKFWAIIGQYFVIIFLLGFLFQILFGKGAIIGGLIAGYIAVKWAFAYVNKGSFSFDDIFEGLTLKKFIYYILAILVVGLSIVLYPLIGFVVGLSLYGISSLITHTFSIESGAALIVFGLAMLLSCIPMMMVAIRLSFAKYIAITKETKPMEALRESKRITKGYRWKLFWFFLAILGVNILGLLLAIVCVFYTAPLTAIATVIVYKKLSNRAEETTPVIDEIIIETVEVVQA